MNTYCKEISLKEVKKKIREENYLKIISVFYIVKKDYRQVITYTIFNKVDKISAEIYIKILKELGKDLNKITL